MIEAVGGDLGAVLRLGENERALEDSLGIERRAFGRPRGVGGVARLGLGDIGAEPLGVLADVAVAGGANGGMGVVGLLHHRAEEAGELRQLALKDRFAEVDIAEDAVARVGQAAIGLSLEQRVGVRREPPRRGDGAGLLACEMVEERALGEPRLGANVLDPRGRIALGTDHMDRRVEELFVRSLRGRRLRRPGRNVRYWGLRVHAAPHTNRSVCVSSKKRWWMSLNFGFGEGFRTPARSRTGVQGEGFRTPARSRYGRAGVRWGRRSKASQGGNRGEVGG